MAEYGNNYDYGMSPIYKDDDAPSSYGSGGYSAPSETFGDIKLFPENGIIQLTDIKVGDRDLFRDPGLETAVLVSLFTNRRAEIEDVLPDNSDDKYGFWGDVLEPNEGDSIGSKLWLIGRHKMVDEVLPMVEEAIKEALKWMIDDGVASSVKAVASRYDMTTVYFEIEIIRPETGESVYYKYYYNWNAQIGIEV